MSDAKETSEAKYARYARAIRAEALPVALVDLDAIARNVETVLAPARAHRKTVRVATKSVRSLDLLRLILRLGQTTTRGVMAYCAAEASYLVGQGVDDILIAYPTAHPRDARRIAEANKTCVVRATADSAEHLALLGAAARSVGTKVPVVVDVDVSYRPLGAHTHIGVRRSPLREARDVVAFVRALIATEGLLFAGLQAYEAHIAGVSDAGSFLGSAAKRHMKLRARSAVAQQRASIVKALLREGIAVPLFNGGGTGSVGSTASEDVVTEIAAGSGFLTSHLFDRYEDLPLEPAVCFALQASRRPGPGFVTCLGGGFVASGSAGKDRLPQPYLPAGLTLTSLEGAGEVQTPLRVPRGLEIPLGAPIFFRHAKTGELSEHFQEYVLVQGDRVEGRVATYRGAGRAFL